MISVKIHYVRKLCILLTFQYILCWLLCRLSFSLLRSSIQAIRGARSSCGHCHQNAHTGRPSQLGIPSVTPISISLTLLLISPHSHDSVTLFYNCEKMFPYNCTISVHNATCLDLLLSNFTGYMFTPLHMRLGGVRVGR